MDRFDNGVRLCRKEATDEVRAGDRLGLGTPLTLELSPDTGEHNPIHDAKQSTDRLLIGRYRI